jgi:hypothetical protein
VKVSVALVPAQMFVVPPRLPVGKLSTVNVTAGVAANAHPGAVVSVTTTLYCFPFNPFTLLNVNVELVAPL